MRKTSTPERDKRNPTDDVIFNFPIVFSRSLAVVNYPLHDKCIVNNYMQIYTWIGITNVTLFVLKRISYLVSRFIFDVSHNRSGFYCSYNNHLFLFVNALNPEIIRNCECEILIKYEPVKSYLLWKIVYQLPIV